jgi:hypothetical protein
MWKISLVKHIPKLTFTNRAYDFCLLLFREYDSDANRYEIDYEKRSLKVCMLPGPGTPRMTH